MEIRKAKRDDRQAVLEFCKDTFPWGDYISDVWGIWESDGGLYVLEMEDAVVGVYHVALLQKEAWLEGMRVHPNHRKKGLGTAMMGHAESVVKEGTIRLVIESENHPSIKMVRNMGYDIESEWRLYVMEPGRETSKASIAETAANLADLADSHTYADSWKWLPLDGEELGKLVGNGRVVECSQNGSVLAAGIWNRSRDFPEAFQIGFINGTGDGIDEILKFAKNRAFETGCRRIQVFAPERFKLNSSLLEVKSLFYLMRKELRKTL
ncbi:MAG: GNAT family N-acetyltransferase [Thaumarchaeota archaeon]|nr:GNAT family N-acetyltransferase [Nitrososphaerota archaeon]